MTDNGEDRYEEERAIGVRGMLIRGAGDEIWFRVTNQDYSFTDYEITNHDCEVVIIDPHAALIRGPAGDFLDYTSESMQVSK